MTDILVFVQQWRVIIRDNSWRTATAIRGAWQIVDDGLIDGPHEDGTNFFSRAAGPSPPISQRNCRGVVVARHARDADARPD
jgi:hypothetical protein